MSAEAPVDRRAVRDAARRAQAVRRTTVSAASTVAVIVLVVLVIALSPGFHEVRAAFFSWGDARRVFPDVIRAFWLDVRVFVGVEVLVLALGLLVAVVRSTRSPALFPARLLATGYVDVFRGLPTLLLIYLIGFGVPALGFSVLPTDPVWYGAAALTLSYGAYVAEVFRAGIESIHPSQRAAARALGLTQGQTLRHVVLPQAIRRVVPPLLNDFISLQKDASLIATLGVLTALQAANVYASEKFNYTPFVVAGCIYLCLTIPLTRFTDRLQRRTAARRGASGTV